MIYTLFQNCENRLEYTPLKTDDIPCVLRGVFLHLKQCFVKNAICVVVVRINTSSCQKRLE